MDTDQIIQLAAEAGKIILENGGETYRVEETISRICDTFNLPNTESFVTPTGIMMSVITNDGKNHSLVKRIKNRSVNLEKVALINDLSRNIKLKSLTLEDVKKALLSIDQVPQYSSFMIILFSAFGAAFFTLLFGGNFSDFIVSFLIAAIIKWLSLTLSRIDVNDFFINVMGGAFSALVALISVHLHFATNVDKIIIGSIMILVPGLAITNAIRDTISGDLLAGISRAVEAFLIAIAIAVGAGSILRLWFVFVGGITL